MGDRDRVYLIEILLRARDEFSKIFENFAKDQKKANESQEESVSVNERQAKAVKGTADALSQLNEAHVKEKKASDDMASSIDALRIKHDKFLETIKKEKVAHQDQVDQLKRFGREWRKLADMADIGSKMAIDLGRAARAAEDHAAQLVYIEKNTRSLIKKELDATDKLRKDSAENKKKIDNEVLRTHEDYANAVINVDKLIAEADERDRQDRLDAERKFNALATKAHIEMISNMEDADARYEAEKSRREKAAAREQEREADRQLKASQKRADELLKQAINQTGKETKDLVGESRALRGQASTTQAHINEVDRVIDSYGNLLEQMNKGGMAVEEVRARLKMASRDFDTLARAEENGSEQQIRFASTAEGARDVLSQYTNEVKRSERETRESNRESRGFFGTLRGGRKDVDDADDGMQRLSLAFQGFQVAFAIKYAQALFTMLAGLAGVLISVASAAVMAGGALVGSLAAGALQAIPVIGLLGAALFGVGQVIKAVNLANQNSLTAGRDAETAARMQEAAAERVHNALMAQADARRALTQAEFDAKRQLEDLIAAQQRADISARGAALSVEEAQAGLRRAINTGDAESVARAQLGLEEAKSNLPLARREARRSNQDLDRALTGKTDLGGEEAARRRLTEATRDLRRARDENADATGRETAAEDRLQAMLAEFSPAQRKLYESMTSTLEFAKKTFIGTSERDGIAGAIIYAFSDALDRAREVLRNNQLVKDLEKLSEGIAKSIKKITGVISSPESVGDLGFFVREATENLPALERIFSRVFSIMRNVAKAASPALSELLDLIEGYLSIADEKTNDNKEGLAKFFSEGVDAIEDFIDLALAAIDVFAALMNAGGAEEGKNAIEDLTGALQDASKWIEDNRRKVSNFFKESRDVFTDTVKAIFDLGVQISSVFDSASFASFSDFVTGILGPAVVAVVKIMGALTQAAHEILELPLVKEFAIWLTAAAFLSRGIGLISKAFEGIVGSLGLVKKEGKWFFVGNPWLLAVMAIVTALILLDGKFGIFEKFSSMFKTNSQKAKDAADQFTDAINRQIEALRRQRDAELGRQNAKLSLSRAEIAVERAQQARADVEKQAEQGELKGKALVMARRDASINLKQALLDERQARLDLKSAKEKEREDDQNAVNAGKKTIDAAQVRINTLKDERSELVERRDAARESVKADEDFLKSAIPGTQEYADAQDRLKISKDQLGEANKRLKGNTDEMKTAGEQATTAFRRWRTAVKGAGKNTDTFADSVNRAMESVVSDVNSVLTEFGAKPLRWTSKRKKTSVESLDGASEVFDTPSIGGFPGRQQGGGLTPWTVPGSGDGDKVLMKAAVEPGEEVYVLNRTASRYRKQLERLNKMVPRFQKGGIVPIPGMPGESINSSILADVMRLIQRYKVRVTDGYAKTGHAANGEHPLGLAVDLVPGDGGSWDLIDQLANWAEPTQGNPRSPFRWVGYTGDANHGRGNHLHLSWQHAGRDIQTLGGAIGMGSQVASRKTDGPAGSLTSLLRRAVNRSVREGNKYLDRSFAGLFAASSDPTTGGASASGNGSDLMRRIAETKGWNFDHWWALDAKETSHGKNLSNPNSTARLRGQFLDMNYGKYGPGSDPSKNPTMAQQIYSMADYIAERYDNPTRALAWHNEHNWYQRGGKVMPFAGFFKNGVDMVVDKATSFVAGEAGKERVTVQPLQSGGGVARATPPGVQDAFNSILEAIDFDTDGIKNVAAKVRKAFNKIFEDGGLFDQMTSAVEAYGRNARQKLISLQYRIDGGSARRFEVSASGTRSATGLNFTDGELQSAELLRREGNILGRERTGLEQQQTSLGLQAYKVQGELARAMARGNKKAEQELRARMKQLESSAIAVNDALVQNAQSMVENQEEFRRAVVAAVDLRNDARSATAQNIHRLMAAFGQAVSPEAVIDKQVDNLNAYVEELKGAAFFAGTQGDIALQTSIWVKINEAVLQIAEAGASRFQAQVDTVNNNASRALAGSSLMQRMAQIGGTNYAAMGSVLRDRGSILSDQRGQLATLLSQASASGNIDQVKKLTDQIAELDVQIAENTQAVQDNTDASVDARISIITEREGFAGGVFGSAISFFKALGSSTGIDQNPAIKGLLASAGSSLSSTQGGLIGELGSLLGYNPDETERLRGLAPDQLVNYLVSVSSGPAFDAIIARLNPTQQSTFKGLINSLLQNTLALQENSDQIKDLNGSNEQEFTSSYWKTFRAAIFDGAGKLLPQYASAVPTSGVNSAAAQASSIMTASPSTSVADRPMYSGSGEQHDHWHITTPKEIVDYGDLDREKRFIRSTKGRGNQ